MPTEPDMAPDIFDHDMNSGIHLAMLVFRRFNMKATFMLPDSTVKDVGELVYNMHSWITMALPILDSLFCYMDSVLYHVGLASGATAFA